jgi:hypothetical protein
MHPVLIVAAAAAALAVMVRRLQSPDPEVAPVPAHEGESLADYAGRMERLADPAAPDIPWADCPCCGAPAPVTSCATCLWDEDYGFGLSERRERFARTGTGYTAEELEDWEGSPPTPEERGIQAEILDLCRQARGGALDYRDWWIRFRDAQDALRSVRDRGL